MSNIHTNFAVFSGERIISVCTNSIENRRMKLNVSYLIFGEPALVPKLINNFK